MWTHIDQNFSTPPPTWRKQRSFQSPMSERKRMSTPSPVNNKDDIFHVVHKVPSGDSPYVRAKRIQLIDKDPSRAVSMFWAAINAGDRVDSALKDMAVVMKQLDRSDEAIEAVKSFRHLCPYDSQESLDNVLIELYKRSGRIEEEIELLQNKLKNIEEGMAFGGAKTKMARSQGKKIQITIEQERSRILGNLAWAYLQQNNYEMAEQYYRRALSLGVDKNKQCNLAICLMHMNRITEAKSLLQAVRASAGNKEMDSSYARSFERAVQMLTELESPSVLNSTELEEDDDQENQRPFAFPANGNLNLQVTGSTREVQNHVSAFSVCRSLAKSPSVLNSTELEEDDDQENQRPFAFPANGNLNLQVTGSTREVQNHVSAFSFCRSLAKGHDEQTVLLNQQDRSAYSRNNLENKHKFFGYDKGSLKCTSGPRETSQFSPQNTFIDNWRNRSYLEQPCGISGFSSTMKANCGSSLGIGVCSAHQETCVPPAAVRRNLEVLFTQPRRRSSREFSIGEWRKDRWVPTGSSNTTYSTVLFTQPRRSSSREHNMEDHRGEKWGEKQVGSSIRKLTFEQDITSNNEQQTHGIPIVNGELIVPTDNESKIGWPNSKNASPSPTSKDWTRRSWEDIAQVKAEPVKQPPWPPVVDGDSNIICRKTKNIILDGMQKMNTCSDDQKKLALEESNSATAGLNVDFDNTAGELNSSMGDQSINILQQSIAEKPRSSQDCFKTKDKKSWADMVEEEENEEQDENLNFNIVYPSSFPQNQIDFVSRKIEGSFDLKDGYVAARNASALPSRNLKARRSLCFDQQQRPESEVHFYSSPLPNKGLKFEGYNSSAPGTMRRNRLQVFRDITPFPDSP